MRDKRDDLMTEDEIEEFKLNLQLMKGLQLKCIFHVLDMLVINFDKCESIKTKEDAKHSTYYSLHIQSSWIFTDGKNILTGSEDLWEPLNCKKHEVDDNWNPHDGENVQTGMLRQILNDNDDRIYPILNISGQLLILSISIDNYCGLNIKLSSNYELSVFPAGIFAENWRLIDFSQKKHAVVAGGKLISSYFT